MKKNKTKDTRIIEILYNIRKFKSVFIKKIKFNSFNKIDIDNP